MTMIRMTKASVAFISKGLGVYGLGAGEEPLACPHPLTPTPVLRMLDDDALDDVGDVLATVNRGFELFVNVFPLDDVEGVGCVAEKVRYGVIVSLVALVLQPMQLDQARGDAVGLG